jgi:hypothetical protein
MMGMKNKFLDFEGCYANMTSSWYNLRENGVFSVDGGWVAVVGESVTNVFVLDWAMRERRCMNAGCLSRGVAPMCGILCDRLLHLDPLDPAALVVRLRVSFGAEAILLPAIRNSIPYTSNTGNRQYLSEPQLRRVIKGQ